ncbi:HemK family methyltransferase [Hyaloscypha finlandica]|nr:HemK family methyltransferase [Hyaloscypha finlandica]
MPRLPHSLLRAHKQSTLLPLVLQGTRDLPSAINELRWLTEHVQSLPSPPPCPRAFRKRLLHLCKRRSRAEPLQYILGSQPFGELDIKCRPGVLIPRPETEAYTTHLAELLIDGSLDEQLFSLFKRTSLGRGRRKALILRNELRILDVCSGSGCISLLLHTLLSKSNKFPNIKTLGLDISPKAVALADENLQKVREEGVLGIDATAPIQFREHDIFTSLLRPPRDYNIIISNPPYISRSSFFSTTSHSVQKYEPRLALVPEASSYAGSERWIQRYMDCKAMRKGDAELAQDADIFYRQLLRIYDRSSSSILLMEVGDQEQAIRVIRLAVLKKHIGKTNRVEIWRDYPAQEAQPGEEQEVEVEGRVIPVNGAGKMRSVVLFRVKKEKMGVGKKQS